MGKLKSINQEQLLRAQEEEAIVQLIRAKYTLNQELAILRQRDTKPEEYAIYNEYVEACKTQVKGK